MRGAFAATAALVAALAWLAAATPLATLAALFDASSGVVDLTPSNWKDTNQGVWLVAFTSPGCGHCRNMSPDYAKAAKALKGIAKVGNVDMTVHQSLGAPYNIQGFPTFKIIADGKAADYNGQRSATAFVDAVTSHMSKLARSRLGGGSSSSGSGSGSGSASSSGSGSSSGSKGSGSGGPIQYITDANFDELVMNNANELVVVSFIAAWCGHCQRAKPELEEAAKRLAGSGIRFYHVESPDNQQVSSRFGIRGFPTIKAFPPGPKSDSGAVEYQGPRDADSISKWAEELFERHGGKVEVEVPELVNQSVFEKTCAASKKCVVVFVEDLLDSGAARRAALLETVKSAAARARHVPFVWVSANAQPAYEAAYDLRFGFPAVLMLREVDGQKVGFVHRGKFTENDVVAFATAPKAASAAVRAGWPTIQKTTPWDGKDAPKPDAKDDDFNLEEFLNS